MVWSRLGYFTFNGKRYSVVHAPMQVGAHQLIIVDEYGSVESVCYVAPGIGVSWKFGAPPENVRGKVEEKILEVARVWGLV